MEERVSPVCRVIQCHVLREHGHRGFAGRVGGLSTDSRDACSRGDVDYPVSCSGIGDRLLDHLFDGFAHGRGASFAVDHHHDISLLVRLPFEIAEGPPDPGVVDQYVGFGEFPLTAVSEKVNEVGHGPISPYLDCEFDQGKNLSGVAHIKSLVCRS